MNGAYGIGTVNHAVYCLALNQVYLLSDNHTITTVDCSVLPVSAQYDGIKSLGCENALPTSALSSVTFTETIRDFAEPLIPALSSQYLPVVTGVPSFLLPFTHRHQLSPL